MDAGSIATVISLSVCVVSGVLAYSRATLTGGMNDPASGARDGRRVPRTLFICHGNDHGFDPDKFPVTVTAAIVAAGTTLDEHPAMRPDIVEDIGKVDLGLPRASFDAVIMVYCSALAFMTPDGFLRERAIANVVDCLKPGGLFFFEVPPAMAIWYNLRVKILPEVDVRVGVDRQVRRTRIRTVGEHIVRNLHESLVVVPDEKIAQTLAGAGFADGARSHRHFVLKKTG